MSREYPCIYFEKDGVCRKLTDDIVIGYCVMGPCPDQKVSNADKIRAMSDEELAKYLSNPEFNSYAYGFAKLSIVIFAKHTCKIYQRILTAKITKVAF